jgi:hypothetical protein
VPEKFNVSSAYWSPEALLRSCTNGDMRRLRDRWWTNLKEEEDSATTENTHNCCYCKPAGKVSFYRSRYTSGPEYPVPQTVTNKKLGGVCKYFRQYRRERFTI